MKRLTTLLLAAGLICSAFSAANAADIKAKGMWDFSFSIRTIRSTSTTAATASARRSVCAPRST